MNNIIKNFKIVFIIILIFIIISPIFYFIFINNRFKEGLTNNDQQLSIDQSIGESEKVHQNMRNNILNDNSLSPIEKIKKLQKISIARTLNKEKQLNFNFNKLVDLSAKKEELSEILADQVNLDNQITNLQEKANNITIENGTKLAKQIFDTAGKSVQGAKLVTSGMNNHLDSMTKPNPFAKNDGVPGSHGDSQKKKCLNDESCQTPAFYKGNYIPTGNALFGTCPCPLDEPDAFGAHWSCCAVPYAD